VLQQLHGRKRLQASEELCACRKLMVGCYQRGRIKVILRNLLGEHKPKFDCDTIRCPLTKTYINHPEELVWVLLLNFQDWFSKPAHHQGPITEEDGDCLKLGTDKLTFQAETYHLGIPDKYTELIWEAQQTVPNKDMIARDFQAAQHYPQRRKNFAGL
jgi:hypothetical protein